LLLWALAWAVSLGTGWCLVMSLWPGGGRSGGWSGGRALLLRLVLALGLGMASQACLHFMAQCLVPTWVPGAPVFDVALLALVSGLWACRRRSASAGAPFAPVVVAPMDQAPYLRLGLLFWLGLSAATAVWVWRSVQAPHGDWDAWMLWNLKARFLFRSPEHGPELLSHPALLHPDYPLLVPETVARLWRWTGSESVLSPAALGIFWAVALPLLLLGSLGFLRGWRAGYLGGLVLLATPWFVNYGHAQMADLPLAFLILAATALLVLAARDPHRDGKYLVLAGLAAGAAAWTKVEGGPFALGALAAAAGIGWAAGGWRLAVRGSLWLECGLAPALACLVLQRVRFGVHNDVIRAMPLWLVSKDLLDWSRHGRILWQALSMFARWPQSLAPVLLLAGALLAGPQRPTRAWRAVLPGVVGLAVMLLSYYAAFLFTPYDLAWHLESSSHRLFLQIWPSVIFLVVLGAQIPPAARVDKPVLSGIAAGGAAG
jgi:hypothetical protein